MVELTIIGPDRRLERINAHSVEMAKALLASGIVPIKASEDAMHISIAAIHFGDYLLTWNCRHIANPERRSVKQSTRSASLRSPI